MFKFICELHYNYLLKYAPCVYLSLFLSLCQSCVQNTKNIILINYKVKKKKKNYIYTIKITICFLKNK